jgi:hypothetical protein
MNAARLRILAAEMRSRAQRAGDPVAHRLLLELAQEYELEAAQLSQPSPPAKRRAVRRAVPAGLRATVFADNGSCPVRLVDLSEAGAGLAGPLPFAVGTDVTLALMNGRLCLAARVAHTSACRSGLAFRTDAVQSSGVRDLLSALAPDAPLTSASLSAFC